MATAIEYGLIAASIAVATITKATALTFTGTVLPGARVQLFDGATELATVTADANGNWDVDTTGLFDGVHVISATVIDDAGSTISTLPPRFLVVDATASVASAVSTVTRPGGVSVAGTTNATAINLSGTAEAGAVVRVFDGADLIGTVTALANGAWNLAATDLAEGTHNFTTTVTDLAGNTSAASAIRDLTVDSIAPVASPVATVKQPDGTPIEVITKEKIVTLSGTAEANAAVRVFDGADLLGTVTADANGAWSFATTDLAEGMHNFATTVIDAAGNTSAGSAIRDLTVDATAPVASAVTTVKRPDGTAVEAITNVKDVTLSGTAEAGATVRVADGATLIGTATADANGAWSVAASGLADGSYNLSTTVTDAAGNTSVTSPLRVLTIDTLAPAAAAVAAFSPDSSVAGDGVTNAKTITLTGTAEAGATIHAFDRGAEIGAAIVDAAGRWNIEVADLAEGAHSITTAVTDTAGNTRAASEVFSVTVDTAAPVITSNGGGATAAVAVAENKRGVTAVAATDARPGSIAYAIVGGADRDKFAVDSATGALVFLAAPDHERPSDAGGDNVYDVVVEARDVDGNADTQALSVAVANVRSETVPGDETANVFVATKDSEVFRGFGGSDTVSYEAAAKGIAASLDSPFNNRGEASGDSYASIENLRGSAFNDKLTGDSRANVLEGGAGGDRLDGGRGMDTASYTNAASGVTANLLKSNHNGGEAAGDTYRSIKSVAGSNFNDTLIGDNSNNAIDSGEGRDLLFGKNGRDTLIGGLDSDVMDGGGGRDTYVYRTPDEGGDTIVRYVAKDDTLQFSASGFDGGLVAGQAIVAGVTFIADAAPVAPTTAGTFLYDTVAQDLSWDADGSDPGLAVKVAHFENPATLTAKDFDIVA